jgi:hypothetical protein
MGGAPVVIVLVSLVFPMLLLLAAVAFDVAMLGWVAFRLWHDRVAPRLRAQRMAAQ